MIFLDLAMAFSVSADLYENTILLSYEGICMNNRYTITSTSKLRSLPTIRREPQTHQPFILTTLQAMKVTAFNEPPLTEIKLL